MSQPPVSPDPADEPSAPDGGQGDDPRASWIRALPGLPEMPSFPAVLPEDPDDRAEVLRRFAEWDAERRAYEAQIVASAFPADSAPDSAERTYNLVERMRELGAPDPESWAMSEIMENIPQEARWLILRAIWPVIDMFSPERMTTVSAAQRLLDAGADPDGLSRAMRHAAMSGVFGALTEIDGMAAMDAPRNAPGWVLMETRYDPDADDYVPTGRAVGGLHESLSSADPSGRGGSDLFE